MDWFRAGQGMARIRHYFLGLAPELRPYIVMPTSDEPWATLSGSGVGTEERHHWWHGFVTAQAVVGTIDSVVAGVLAGIAASGFTDRAWVAVVLGAVGAVVSAIALTVVGNRGFFRRMRDATVAFPSEPEPATDGARG